MAVSDRRALETTFIFITKMKLMISIIMTTPPRAQTAILNPRKSLKSEGEQPSDNVGGTVSEAKTSPVISTSIEDTVLTLTLSGGEMPQGLEDGTRYLIEIHSDDTGYDELTYFNYSLDEETILIFNLQNGGIGGDPGSNNHDDATTGTYTFQLSCDGVVFYRGSFNIS